LDISKLVVGVGVNLQVRVPMSDGVSESCQIGDELRTRSPIDFEFVRKLVSQQTLNEFGATPGVLNGKADQISGLIIRSQDGLEQKRLLSIDS
jgi:hypothetical protein